MRTPPTTLAEDFYFGRREHLKTYHFFNCGTGLSLYPTWHYKECTLSQLISELDKDHSFVRKRKGLAGFQSKAEKHLHILNKIGFSLYLSYKEFLATPKNHHVFIQQTLIQVTLEEFTSVTELQSPSGLVTDSVLQFKYFELTFYIPKIHQTGLLGFIVLGSFPVAKFSSVCPLFPEHRVLCSVTSHWELSHHPSCFGKAPDLSAHLLLSS